MLVCIYLINSLQNLKNWCRFQRCDNEHHGRRQLGQYAGAAGDFRTGNSQDGRPASSSDSRRQRHRPAAPSSHPHLQDDACHWSVGDWLTLMTGSPSSLTSIVHLRFNIFVGSNFYDVIRQLYGNGVIYITICKPQQQFKQKISKGYTRERTYGWIYPDCFSAWRVERIVRRRDNAYHR